MYLYLYPVFMKKVFGVHPAEKSIFRRRLFVHKMPWPLQRHTRRPEDDSKDAISGDEKQMGKMMGDMDAEAGPSPRTEFFIHNKASTIDLALPHRLASDPPASRIEVDENLVTVSTPIEQPSKSFDPAVSGAY